MPVKSNCDKSENHLLMYLIECFNKRKKYKMVPEIKFTFKTLLFHYLYDLE